MSDLYTEVLVKKQQNSKSVPENEKISGTLFPFLRYRELRWIFL